MSNLLRNLLLVLAGGTLLAACAACSSTKEPVQEASAPVAEAPAVSNHNAVYFAFNKYNVGEGYNGIVQANGNYLANNPGAKVQVQGNADAMGSVEYNLALGNRRARAVKNALIADGAKKGQIEAVSYGKLKPKYPNDTADNRAHNRRADIVYKMMQPQGYSVDSMNGLPMVNGSFYNGTVMEGVQ